jgi:hypothetical protein
MGDSEDGVPVSPVLQAILDAQKESILSAVNNQLQGLHSSFHFLHP